MRSLLTIPLLTLITTSAGAEPLSAKLRECAAIEADSQRLACYDALSKALDSYAVQSFGREQQHSVEEAPDSINASITEIRKTAYGKALITLDNGQRWLQNDSNRVSWKSGQAVVVERGLLGSFFMKPADGRRKIRVKRID